MEILTAFAIGLTFAVGLFQILRRNVIRAAMGLMLLANAVNLFLLTTGATWGVGTALGFVQTTNGGGNLATLRNTPTGYAYIEVTETKPAGTSITYDILDRNGTPVTGYQGMTASGSPARLDISGISYSSPTDSLQIRVNLATTNTSATPVLHDMKIAFRYP